MTVMAQDMRCSLQPSARFRSERRAGYLLAPVPALDTLFNRRGVARAVLVAWLVGSVAAPLAAQEAPRPRVGLVLSSGGARGLAHVGALAAFEELRVPVDLVVGTEVGALVGGFHASGLDAATTGELLSRPLWIDALRGQALRRSKSWRQRSVDRDFLIDLPLAVGPDGPGLAKGLIDTRWIAWFVGSSTMPVLGTREFDALPTRFRSVVVDPLTGDVVALASGDISAAIVAGLSTPGRHGPVEIDGRLFVTGAVLAPIPVRTALDAGCETLIVIDCAREIDAPQRLATFTTSAAHVAVLAGARSRREARSLLRSHDLWIEPHIDGIGEERFVDVASIVALGREAVLARADEFAHLALDEEDWAAHLAARAQRVPVMPVIGHVRIEDETGLDASVFEARMESDPGERVDPDVLAQDLLRLYGLDYHERIEPRLEPNDDGTSDLVLETHTNDDDLWNLRGGVAFEGVLGRDATIVFGTSFTLRPLDGRGAEWRNRVEVGSRVLVFSEYWQPLDPSARWFVAPAVGFEQERLEISSGDTTLASYDATALAARLDAGRVLGEWAEARIGLVQAIGELDLAIGDPATLVQSERFDEGFLQASVTIDTLDSLALPREGWVGRVAYRSPVRFLEGDDLQYLTAQIDRASTFGRTTILAGGEFDTALDDETAQQNSFQLGGFLRLSGLGRDTLGGPHAGLLRLVGWHALGVRDLERAAVEWNVGASIEAGATWLDRSDISVSDLRLGGSLFVALETLVGPIFAGVGYTEPDEVAVFIAFGNQFADWDTF
jgi:NTE family protein